jgi:diphthine-ammonia ligase
MGPDKHPAVGVLFSGGKDSAFATYLAKREGYRVACLISILSENMDSYMFHTPAVSKVRKQAEAMNVPLVLQKTKGVKESELKDLEKAIRNAKEKYKIQGIVTGAVESVYQASRVQEICNELDLECFNPLWQKDQIELLEELVKYGFMVIITSVAAYPLDGSWLGKEIDRDFIVKMKALNEKYKINPAGEGGEFETFTLYSPLFRKRLRVKDKIISGKENSWRMELEV